MLTIIKWTAVANIESDNNITLHRELDFSTEEEIDSFIASTSDHYEKIPVWGEMSSYNMNVDEDPEPIAIYN